MSMESDWQCVSVFTGRISHYLVRQLWIWSARLMKSVVNPGSRLLSISGRGGEGC